MENRERVYFGTDGIRGRVNSPPLTPQFIQGLGAAAALWFKEVWGRFPKVGVGFDTRNSRSLIAYSLASGAAAVGADVEILGILPTPAVAHWAKTQSQPSLGAVISASHNPFWDNGIKFFTPRGYKLSDAEELQIEEKLERWLGGELSLAPPEELGSIRDNGETERNYSQYLYGLWPKELVPEGIKLVIDAAHGAAYKIAPELFRRLGLEVTTICTAPDGKNINENCGALHPENLAREVVSRGAHLGFALDGDADRLIAVDENGNIVDGDRILFLCATYLQRRGQLRNSAVVATVMSNLGLERSLQKFNIRLLRTPVGDRYVSAKLREENLSLGGEESGHIIFSDYSTTGDGILTALQILKIVAEEKKCLSELLTDYTSYPQVKISVPVREKKPWEEIPAISRAIREAEEKLADRGRILIRYSGTENKARIMLEGPDKPEITELAEQIAESFRKELGLQ